MGSAPPSGSWLNDSTPKIADFGIAKHLQGGGQTREGDIWGTACYMSPEQATGKAMEIGPASDIYSLGVILYEMLTGRVPLQGATDLETVRLVDTAEPVPPRRLQPGLPRDLETICLKCLRKEPAARYASADDLALDLGRFLASEPIAARRIGIWERGVKWLKRRPAVAALLAVSAAAAFSLIIGILIYNARLALAFQDAQANLEKARRAEEQARLADQEKTRQLALAQVKEARARRNSGLVGRRFESLEALKKAMELFRGLSQVDEKQSLELRNEAIACLALADLKPGPAWIQQPGWSQPSSFDPTLQYYVIHSPCPDHPENHDIHQGQLSIRRIADHHEVARLPGFGVRVVRSQFSPDSRYLAVHYEQGQRHNYVWDLSRREAILVQHGAHEHPLAFSPDSRLAAIPQPDESISIYELPSGAKWKDLPSGPPVERVLFHPDSRWLSIVRGSTVQLLDLSVGMELARFQHPSDVAALAWRSDGKILATAGGEEAPDIYLWDVANAAQPLRILKGHFGGVVNVRFSHGGDLLFSNSWDSTDRLWDPRTGQLLLSKPGGVYREHLFRLDDQQLDQGWQVATGRECRTFHGSRRLRAVAISPKGRLMASVSADGVQLWDLTAAREGDKQLAKLPVGLSMAVRFDPNGQSLITVSRSAGLQRWPIASDLETGGLRIGPPQSLGLSARAPFSANDPDFTLSSDGRTIAYSPQRGQVLLFDLENPRRKLLIESPYLRSVAFSPDGRWLATGNWQGRGAKVWDTQTGEVAHECDLGQLQEGTARPGFSPDGKWLVTGSSAEYRFWEVGSWQMKHGLPRENAGLTIARFVFAPDGKMLAVLHSMTEVRLVDPATGREFARLPTAGYPYCFSPDGSHLVTYAGSEGTFQVWDLRLIRQQLKEMELDWDLPPYPPPPSHSDKPLRIKVLAAEPPPPSKELDAQAHLERGLLYVQLRHYSRAVEDFSRASILNPQRPPWEEVVRAYSQVLERYPQEAEAYHQRAHAHVQLGQWEKAISDHSQAVTKAPRRLDLLVSRGRTYLRVGRKDKAAEDFRRASEGKADQAFRLAWELVTSPDLLDREPSLAVELANQAVRQAPAVATYWNTLGVAHYRVGEWEAAIKALEEAQNLGSSDCLGSNAFFLAMCHHQLDDPAGARCHYGRAVRWSQENEGKLSAHQQQELKAFRVEAEALLKAPLSGP